MQNFAKYVKLWKICKFLQNVQILWKMCNTCKCGKLWKMWKIVQNLNCVRCAKFGKMYRIVQKLCKLKNMCKSVQHVQSSFFFINVQDCAKFSKFVKMWSIEQVLQTPQNDVIRVTRFRGFLLPVVWYFSDEQPELVIEMLAKLKIHYNVQGKWVRSCMSCCIYLSQLTILSLSYVFILSKKS